MHIQRLIRFAILTLVLILSLTHLTACIYRPPIEQGNRLEKTKIKKIHVHMTKKEVEDTLGQPVLKNIYQDNRLVYVYTLKMNHKKRQKQQLLIYFRAGRVSHYQFFSSPCLKPPF